MGDYSERVAMGNILKQQIEQARLAHVAATAKFDLVVRERPGSVPHPDGTLRIQQAGVESRHALELYMAAVKRFSDFTISGVVPDDLLPRD
jgi:hypothetical protein